VIPPVRLALCGWCERRVGVESDPAFGLTRFGEHAKVGPQVEPCPGSGRPVTATPVGNLLDAAITRSRGPREDH
jgi:hypothetical protein